MEGGEKGNDLPQYLNGLVLYLLIRFARGEGDV